MRKSSRHTPTAEQIENARQKRAELSALCRPIVKARKAGALPFAALPTVNACLELIYQSRTGQSEWGTFMSWKKLGFAVKKGEKGFAIWGSPLNSDGKQRNATEERRAISDGEISSDDGPSFFPISYIFHAGQVQSKDGAAPGSFNFLGAAFAAVRNAPLALPAPATV